MNPQHSVAQAMFAIRPKLAPNDAIEWEEMPALQPMEPTPMQSRPAARMAPRELARSSSVEFAAWGVTMPAELELDTEPAAFHEPLRGLAVREMNEPDLFKHFFG